MTPEYAQKHFEKYRWEYHGDKSVNDYRSKEDERTHNEGFKSREEEEEYLDLLLSREEQGLPNYY